MVIRRPGCTASVTGAVRSTGGGSAALPDEPDANAADPADRIGINTEPGSHSRVRRLSDLELVDGDGHGRGAPPGSLTRLRIPWDGAESQAGQTNDGMARRWCRHPYRAAIRGVNRVMDSTGKRSATALIGPSKSVVLHDKYCE